MSTLSKAAARCLLSNRASTQALKKVEAHASWEVAVLLLCNNIQQIHWLLLKLLCIFTSLLMQAKRKLLNYDGGTLESNRVYPDNSKLENATS